MTNINIPVADPQAGYIAHQAEIDAAIAGVLRSGQYILGPQTEAFEAEFATYVGVKHGIGVGSGTEALHLALRACGIGQGDQVVTVSHTAVATVAAIELCGAQPVLVDIDPVTYTIDVVQLDAVLASSANVKALIPVHLYGHPAQMAEILAIARKHGIYVIEDCAQAHGAEYLGKKIGAWGDIAAFSFYPTKNLGALGDGGMILTDDTQLAEQARLWRQYGWRRRYISDIPGSNSRLDELQAAILRVKLKYLDQETQRRGQLAQMYHHLLQQTSVTLPTVAPGCTHAHHLYVVRSRQRDALRNFLSKQGIGTGIHYQEPVHLQPAYQGRIKVGPALTHTEQVVQEILSLPMYPQLSNEAIDRVADAIHRFEVEAAI